ncbi:YHS domain-containing (seleno)protein [Ruegeria sp.]|uniref:YHS domain-containing (seleno)protein n=1 Tax=Ruegeria sp. TaxID=1879320 RepID=UPI003B5C7255
MKLPTKLFQRFAQGLALAVTVTAFAAFSAPAQAAEELNVTADGIAMDGFDVISYFDAHKPAKGVPEYSVDYRGATWLFSTEENRDKFAADPASFEPKYNGWCSNAVSKGYSADVDFVNGWAVINGGLHLFWAEGTKHNFLSEVTAKQVRAEDNWPTVLDGIRNGTVKFPRHADYYDTVGITHPQELPES